MKKLLTLGLVTLLVASCGIAPAGRTALGPRATTLKARDVGSRTMVGKLLVNGAANAPVTPGKAAELAFSFFDGTTGQPITQFEIEHGKYMHLVAVSADLETFAHVHPDLEPGRGVFRIGVNRPTSDPDNQDAARAFPKPGPYFLFGEVAPKTRHVEQPRFALRAEGQAKPVPLTLDPVGPDGTIAKSFAPAGAPAYRVGLRVTKGEHHPGMPMWTFDVNVAVATGPSTYAPVTDLEPWLGMPGHAIMISAAGQQLDDKVFRHLHAGHGDHEATTEGGGHGGGTHVGPDVSFMVMGDDVPAAGVYKLWTQFKHRGRILTFPFVFKV